MSLETLTWDAQFVDHSRGLGKPVDYLPGVTDEEERRLLTDAHVVYETLKAYDIAYLQALGSSDPATQQDALNDQQAHESFVQSLASKIIFARETVEQHHQLLSSVAQKYTTADQQYFNSLSSKHDFSTDAWVRQRITPFKKIQAASDVDKTVTENANYLQMIPGSVQAENYMAHDSHGRATFPLVFSRYWREATKILAANFFLIGKNVPLRPGVEDFLYNAQSVDIPVTLTSANFRPLIDGIMSKLPLAERLESFAVEENDISATDKTTILRKLVIAKPDLALIYAGDGDSDFPAAEPEAASVIACYFALRGGSFAKLLDRKNLPFYEFDSFHDINKALARVGAFPNE